MFGENSGLPFSRHHDVLHATPEDNDSLIRLVEELKRRGNQAFTHKNYDEADALYSKAIIVNENKNPLKNQHVFLANRSAARCSMGQFDTALADAEAAIAQDSTYIKGYFRQAQALKAKKEYKAAIKVLQNALSMDPDNKSMQTLLSQVQTALTTHVEPAKSTTDKKVERKVYTVSDKTETKQEKKIVSETEETEDITGHIRGYKKLADGRVTTFFNNELSEEAKTLIGDIAPKKVDNLKEVTIKNVDGGSAWNQGNTFEEKDMTQWAKTTLREKLQTMQVGDISVESVSDISGDASIAVVRGAKRYIFDVTFTLHCIYKADVNIKGDLKIMDLSSDASDDDWDVDVTVPSRHSSPSGKALYTELSKETSDFRKELVNVIHEFKKAYHQF